MKRAAVALATSSAVALASLAAPAMAQEDFVANPTPPVADRSTPDGGIIADRYDNDPKSDYTENQSGPTSEIEGIIAAIAAIMGIAAIAGAATAGAPLGGFQF